MPPVWMKRAITSPYATHSCDQRREGTRSHFTGVLDIGDELVMASTIQPRIERPKSPATPPDPPRSRTKASAGGARR